MAVRRRAEVGICGSVRDFMDEKRLLVIEISQFVEKILKRQPRAIFLPKHVWKYFAL